MAKNIHAYIHANGPDLEDHDLAISCDDFSIEERRAKWAEARKRKLALVSARFDALRQRSKK